jgi:hypothetical protein
MVPGVKNENISDGAGLKMPTAGVLSLRILKAMAIDKDMMPIAVRYQISWFSSSSAAILDRSTARSRIYQTTCDHFFNML